MLKFVILSLVFIAFLGESARGELKFVLEMCRHGARSTYNLAIDPYQQVWKYGSHELTDSGMRQHFLLGQEVRHRYIDELKFLDSQYNSYQIYFRATDNNRTIQSAQTQFTGLYPPNNRANLTSAQAMNAKPPITLSKPWDEEIGNWVLPQNFQQVPLHVYKSEVDDVLDISFCPKIMEIEDKEVESEAVKLVIKSYRNTTIAQLEAALGISLASYGAYELDDLSDALYCDVFDGRTTNISAQLLADSIKMVHDIRMQYMYVPSVIELANSGFVREIIRYFDQSVTDDLTGLDDSRRLKFVLFSGHDTNIVVTNLGLRIPIITNPLFASTLFFELHLNESSHHPNPKDNYFVKVLFNDADIDFTKQCATKYCSLTAFETLARNSVYKGDLIKRCKQSEIKRMSKSLRGMQDSSI